MTSSYSGVTGGGSALNPDPTPQFAPEIEKQNKVLQRDIDRLNQSINANDQANMLNAQQVGSDLKALAGLAKSLTGVLVKKQQEKNQDEMVRGLIDAYESGDTDTSEVDQQEAEFEQDERDFQKATKDVDEETIDRVKRQSPWYEYGQKIGQIQQTAGQYGSYMEQAKLDSPTIEIDGRTIQYDSSDPVDRSAWRTHHRSQFIKQFAGHKDKLIIKHVFPSIRQYDKADEKLALAESIAALKVKRGQEAKQGLLNGLQSSTPGEGFLKTVSNGVLNRKEISDELKFLATNKLLNASTLAKLKRHEFVHKGTGKKTTIGEEFERELAPAEMAIQTAEKNDYNYGVYLDNKRKDEFEQNAIEEFRNDPDGFTKDNVEDFQKALISEGLGRSTKLDELGSALSVDALTRKEKLDEAQGLVDKGVMRQEDLQYYPADIKAIIGPQISSAKYRQAQKQVDDQYNLVEDMVKTNVRFNPDKSYNWTVNAKVIEQQQKFLNNLAVAKLDIDDTNPAETAFQMTRQAFEQEQTKLTEQKLKEKDADGLITSYPEMATKYSKLESETAKLRQQSITNALGKDNPFSDPEDYYTVDQFKKITKTFGGQNFEIDEVAARGSRVLRMHPITFYNRIGEQFKADGKIPDFEPIKYPEKIQVAEQELTPAQKNLIYNFGSRKRIHRALGNPESWPIRGASFETQTPEWKKLSSAIRFGEGTLGDAGYSTMFGGSVFEDFEDHPRQINSSGGYTSDAAGAYQFLSTTYQPIAENLGLNDFSPNSQERAARYLVEEKGIDPDAPITTKEQFADVMEALAPIWASLPTKEGVSAFGQPVKSIDELWQIYQSN